MKNVTILLVLSLFYYLHTSLESGVLTRPTVLSIAYTLHSTDAFLELLLSDVSCFCGEADGSDTKTQSGTGQANMGLSGLHIVCTRTRCAQTPDVIDPVPSVPVPQATWPVQSNEDGHRFEAPDMLAGAIIEC